MTYLRTLLVILLVAILSTASFAGGPITKVKPPEPVIIYQPMLPPPPPPILWPRMKAFGSVTVYATDYSATLTQPTYGSFNFGGAFLWNSKEAFTEFAIGAMVPGYVEGNFTWITPITKAGVGIPTVPITVAGYTFGPRLADTIKLTSTLYGKSLFVTSPYLFSSRKIMPALMAEWWHLNVGVVGVPQTGSTSVPSLDVKQDFSKVVFGLGAAGEFCDSSPVCLSYKALFTTGGNATGGLAQADFGYKQNNMSIVAGWRYNLRRMVWGTGNLDISTNGPYATLSILF